MIISSMQNFILIVLNCHNHVSTNKYLTFQFVPIFKPHLISKHTPHTVMYLCSIILFVHIPKVFILSVFDYAFVKFCTKLRDPRLLEFVIFQHNISGFIIHQSCNNFPLFLLYLLTSCTYTKRYTLQELFFFYFPKFCSKAKAALDFFHIEIIRLYWKHTISLYKTVIYVMKIHEDQEA